ncbi:hypothetical protein MUP77_04395 [Candidatus Bathyarchaeota archaeon]|nr:hypothetical protein [Candidatus Bathyarchaeota archaeon]
MRSTAIGPYPRVDSEYGDELRRELNRFYKGLGDIKAIQQLKEDLTREVVRKMVSTGIGLPNSGLVDVHDELTWPLEYVDGVRFGGIKKIFHTNTHYREVLVNDEIVRKKPFVGDLYWVAREIQREVKAEFPGPYTMAKHSKSDEKSPYRNSRDLAFAYAELFREELSELRDVPLVQFNEPSIIAFGRQHEDIGIIPELYERMLDGLNVRVAVCTFYGEYSPEALDMLLSLPVKVIGLDLVWDPNVENLLEGRLKNGSTNKGICFGIIDSGDRGYIGLEDSSHVLEKCIKLKKTFGGLIDFDNSFISCNATLEHLPEDMAEHKLRLIGEAVKGINE